MPRAYADRLEERACAPFYAPSPAPETRLQRLRRLRSERLRERADQVRAFRAAMGWACHGCGCDREDYSLDCNRCWERAAKTARFDTPQRAAAATYLAERRLHAAEKNRAHVTAKNTADPWPKGRPEGAAGFWHEGSGLP